VKEQHFGSTVNAIDGDDASNFLCHKQQQRLLVANNLFLVPVTLLSRVETERGLYYNESIWYNEQEFIRFRAGRAHCFFLCWSKLQFLTSPAVQQPTE
jgi:hypothetical protein